MQVLSFATNFVIIKVAKFYISAVDNFFIFFARRQAKQDIPLRTCFFTNWTQVFIIFRRNVEKKPKCQDYRLTMTLLECHSINAKYHCLTKCKIVLMIISRQWWWWLKWWTWCPECYEFKANKVFGTFLNLPYKKSDGIICHCSPATSGM